MSVRPPRGNCHDRTLNSCAKDSGTNCVVPIEKKRKTRIGICTYCGVEGPITRDHVPPKGIFGNPLPAGLLTVPSCAACNGGASKGDEYLRMIVALHAGSGDGSGLAKVRESTIRALQRPEAAGLRKSLLDNVKETFTLGPGGMLVPTVIGTVDNTRLDAVIARIIKALFFVQRQIRLPPEYVVVNYSIAGLRQLPKSVGTDLAARLDVLMAPEPSIIGDSRFLFWSDYQSDDMNQSMWLIVIHKVHSFIGWTRRA